MTLHRLLTSIVNNSQQSSGKAPTRNTVAWKAIQRSRRKRTRARVSDSAVGGAPAPPVRRSCPLPFSALLFFYTIRQIRSHMVSGTNSNSCRSMNRRTKRCDTSTDSTHWSSLSILLICAQRRFCLPDHHHHHHQPPLVCKGPRVPASLCLLPSPLFLREIEQARATMRRDRRR